MDQSPDKYGVKIYFTSRERRAEVLCFKDVTANILREYQNDTDVGEKRKILDTAVKLILNDIS